MCLCCYLSFFQTCVCESLFLVYFFSPVVIWLYLLIKFCSLRSVYLIYKILPCVIVLCFVYFSSFSVFLSCFLSFSKFCSVNCFFFFTFYYICIVCHMVRCNALSTTTATQCYWIILVFVIMCFPFSFSVDLRLHLLRIADQMLNGSRALD